jgi:hypothetical protein
LSCVTRRFALSFDASAATCTYHRPRSAAATGFAAGVLVEGGVRGGSPARGVTGGGTEEVVARAAA